MINAMEESKPQISVKVEEGISQEGEHKDPKWMNP
jgi:hypothetical protein